MRDIRTMNMTEGQKAESDTVFKRIGDLAYRNLGSFAKLSLIDTGKVAIIGDGLRVEASSGMTVNVPSGAVMQRFVDVIPCIQKSAQTVTLDAATGVARTDIIEAQIKVVTDKNDTVQTATVASGSAISITNETIKRDIKYYLSCRKQTGTTTPTSATAGTLTGTVAIPGTIDLSEIYLLNMADGEDGSYQEIDLRGATPEATTKAEIIANINTAVGRTMASAGGGDVIVLTGEGTGETSYFEIKPPYTDSDKDALAIVFGTSIGGVYRYTFRGTNEWFKLSEIDVGAATTVITTGLIRNINQKATWASDGDDTIVTVPALTPLASRDVLTSIASTDYMPIESSGYQKSSQFSTIVTEVQSQSLLRSKTVTSATYIVTNADMEDYDMIEFDTTSNAIVVTMADRATNDGHRIILKHAIQDVSLDIVTINRAGTDTITADALTSIELPKVGNYLEVFASSVTTKWEILSESITSKMRLHTYAGYGSSDTMIMRFTTKVEYIGNMFTQNHDSGYNGNTEGLIVTVNRSGKYGCQHSFLSNLGERNNGLSLNSAQLSTSIASITVGDRLNHTINTRTYFVPASHHATYDFVKGDFICPHGDANAPIEAVVKAIFTFVYLGQ